MERMRRPVTGPSTSHTLRRAWRAGRWAEPEAAVGKMQWEDRRRYQRMRDASGGRNRPQPGKDFPARYGTTICARCHQQIAREQLMHRHLDGWAHKECP